MGKRERRRFTEDFKREAVRLTETSGRTIAQVADDCQFSCHGDRDVVAIPGAD